MKLRFRNGKFKILAIADAQDTDTPQKETIDIIKASIRASQPDLAVLLGDNTAGDFPGVNEQKTLNAIKILVDIFEKEELPFALVFGNHDHEGLMHKCAFTEQSAKEFIMNAFCKSKYCLAEAGSARVGCGNYNLPIYSQGSESPAFNLWFIDSNAYGEAGGYGYPLREQNEWYIQKSNQLRKQNGGTPLPSILFQHIAVPEVYSALSEQKIYTPFALRGQTRLYKKFYKPKNTALIQGSFREAPCCADVLHEQFSYWKRQGDIGWAFFGHDHPNDFLIEHKGIKLCAVPAAGYFSYGNFHGSRCITIYENSLEVQTEVLKENELLNYKVRPLYKKRHGYYEYQKKILRKHHTKNG